MQDFYTLSIKLHVIFIYITLAFVILNLYLLKSQNPKRKYLAFLPLYYAILTCVAFTGVVLIGFVKNWLIVGAMIVGWIVILVGSIKSYKKLKYTNKISDDIMSFLVKKSYLDLGVLFLFLILGKI